MFPNLLFFHCEFLILRCVVSFFLWCDKLYSLLVSFFSSSCLLLHRISNNWSYHWHLSHLCEHLSRYGRKFPPRLWFLCHCPVFLFYFRRSYPITIIYSRQIYTFLGFSSTSATCAPEWKEGNLFSRFWCYWLCLFIENFPANTFFTSL